MVIRMVMAVRKHLQITNMIILDNLGFKNCLKKSIPGDVQAQVLQVPVGGYYDDQDGHGCPETPSNYNMIILDSFGFKKYLKKSIPGDIWAQVLQVPVGGSHGDQDAPGPQETPSDY